MLPGTDDNGSASPKKRRALGLFRFFPLASHACPLVASGGKVNTTGSLPQTVESRNGPKGPTVSRTRPCVLQAESLPRPRSGLPTKAFPRGALFPALANPASPLDDNETGAFNKGLLLHLFLSALPCRLRIPRPFGGAVPSRKHSLYVMPLLCAYPGENTAPPFPLICRLSGRNPVRPMDLTTEGTTEGMEA